MKMNFTKRQSLSILFALFIVLCASHGEAKKSKDDKNNNAPLSGEGSNSFGLSPLSFELKCHEGENLTTNLRITNTNNTKTLVSIVTMGLVPIDGGLATKPLASLPENNLARNITIETPFVDIPENSYKDVSLSINVPQGLQGTQYAGITAAKTNNALLQDMGVDRPQEFTTTMGVAMQPAIGVTIKCDIENTLVYDLRVTDVRVAPADQGIVATAKFDNRGNAEMQFVPFLTIIDAQNKVIARFKGDHFTTLYPKTIQSVDFQPLFKEIPSGHYKVVVSIPNEEYKIIPITTSIDIK